jgi:hypothetical protein
MKRGETDVWQHLEVMSYAAIGLLVMLGLLRMGGCATTRVELEPASGVIGARAGNHPSVFEGWV